MPTPFRAAAIVPATCVPWPFSSTSAGSSQDPSGSSAQGPSMAGMSVVKLRLRSASTLGARSGCDASMPVSITPTSTSARPRSVAKAPRSVAPIIAMSHCRAASGSPVGAWAASRIAPVDVAMTGSAPARPAAPIDRAPPEPGSNPARAVAAGSRRGSTRSAGAGSRPIGRFRAAPASAGWRPARSTKSGAPARTRARPIAAFSLTRRAPAAASAACADPGDAPGA